MSASLPYKNWAARDVSARPNEGVSCDRFHRSFIVFFPGDLDATGGVDRLEKRTLAGADVVPELSEVRPGAVSELGIELDDSGAEALARERILEKEPAGAVHVRCLDCDVVVRHHNIEEHQTLDANVFFLERVFKPAPGSHRSDVVAISHLRVLSFAVDPGYVLPQKKPAVYERAFSLGAAVLCATGFRKDLLAQAYGLRSDLEVLILGHDFKTALNRKRVWRYERDGVVVT